MTLTAQIKKAKTITATLKRAGPIKANIKNISIVVGDGRPYDGEYSVKPSFENQKLMTKNRILTDDIAIAPISVIKTTNISGGNTVIIGG